MKGVIKKMLRRLFNLIEFPRPNDTRRRLQERATDRTCEYIEKSMMNVASQDSALDVLKLGLKNVDLRDGLFLEFGVYSGDTINFIATNTESKVFGFDSFEGLPEFWRDGFEKGTFKKDKIPAVGQNVTLVKGLFSETLPKFASEQGKKISFLHIDCDLYSSTKTIFTILSGHITKGTVIVFDEYFNYPGWENGEFKAFKEYVAEKNVKYEYLTYNRLHEQVALKITSVDTA